MRIALIGDSHGFIPPLEAALAACRAAGPDLVLFCGDLLTCPYSPDPPAESIALLRDASIPAVRGNHEVLLSAYGTSEWEPALAMRTARNGDPPGRWIDHVEAGQLQIAPADLRWLRDLPNELVVDANRPGGVYLSHGLPGNPFLSVDGSDPREADLGALREAALARAAPAAADLVLVGHNHVPATLRRDRQIIVRTGAAMGWGSHVRRAAGYTILTWRDGEWDVEHGIVPFMPRDPDWTWARSLEVEIHRR